MHDICQRERSIFLSRFSQQKDTVDMIRHDDKFINISTRIPNWYLFPGCPNHLACRIFLHLAVTNLSEKAGAILNADCYEINPRLCVIIAGQPD